MNNSECKCSTYHVPSPHKMFPLVVGTETWYLCPTTFYNVESLRDRYREYNGIPPGSVRKHYSKFVQQIVSELEGK